MSYQKNKLKLVLLFALVIWFGLLVNSPPVLGQEGGCPLGSTPITQYDQNNQPYLACALNTIENGFSCPEGTTPEYGSLPDTEGNNQTVILQCWTNTPAPPVEPPTLEPTAAPPPTSGGDGTSGSSEYPGTEGQTGVLQFTSTNPGDYNYCPDGKFYDGGTGTHVCKPFCPSDMHWTDLSDCWCNDQTLAPTQKTLTDPKTGLEYSLPAGCVDPNSLITPASQPVSEVPPVIPTEQPGFWARQSPGTKTAIVVLGIGTLIGIGILLLGGGWAAATAGAGAGAAEASSGMLATYAGDVVTTWAAGRAIKTAVQALAKQVGAELLKKLGRRAVLAEVMEGMLVAINARLVALGMEQWTMAQLETMLWGIDLIW